MSALKKVYVNPTGGRPVPTDLNAVGRRHAPKRKIPTGLDWAAHRAPDAAPEGTTVTGPRTKAGHEKGEACWVCNQASEQLDKSHICPSCVADAERRRALQAQRTETPPPAPPAELKVFPRPVPQTRVDVLLASLGVTSHDVKIWAVDQGLLTAVKRGRIRGAIVEAYAEAHR